jgi:hypothetical protein
VSKPSRFTPKDRTGVHRRRGRVRKRRHHHPQRPLAQQQPVADHAQREPEALLDVGRGDAVVAQLHAEAKRGSATDSQERLVDAVGHARG